MSLSTRKVSVLCLLINYPHSTHSPLPSPPAARGAPKAKSAAKPAAKPAAKRAAKPLNTKAAGKRPAVEPAEERAEDPPEDPTIDKMVKIGATVHIPASAFPEEKPPKCKYWVGKVVKTSAGGRTDVGIHVEGEAVFTRNKAEVAGWLVQ